MVEETELIHGYRDAGGRIGRQIQNVIDRLIASGFDVHRSTGASHTVLGAVGVHRDFDHRDLNCWRVCASDAHHAAVQIGEPAVLNRKGRLST